MLQLCTKAGEMLHVLNELIDAWLQPKSWYVTVNLWSSFLAGKQSRKAKVNNDYQWVNKSWLFFIFIFHFGV